MYNCKSRNVLVIYKYCLRLDYSKKKQKTKNKKQKKRKKERKEKISTLQWVWAIPIPISTTKDVVCCSNGYIYHFLDYIVADFCQGLRTWSIHRRKRQGSSWRDVQISHICNWLISLIMFRCFSFLRTALLLRLDSKPTQC